ncbi:MAG: hypothetical protein ABJP79_08420 [Tateyamaria sp.]|uniref:hypothetical protein n=1 Tax=Tateyamaria sp. TaxID=1929288 RepID=UPI00329E2E58
MKRTAAVCVLALGVAACSGGNPFDDGDDGTDDAVSPTNIIDASESNEELTGNGLVFSDNGTPADPTDDTLVINNIPFDNVDSTGGAYTRTGALPNGFERYESPVLGTEGELNYFAVFRRSELAQVAAVGTGDFVTPGTGGLIAERTGSAGVPNARPASYTFTGDYAAVRIGTINGGSNDVTFVTGETILTADILDFDNDGAVTGVVVNRELFDANGASLGDLNDFISLTTTGIDFENATIEAAQATTIEDGEALGTGEWQGIFAGPNGEEIAGIIVIEGSTTDGEPDDTVRETGTFIVVNGG